MALPISQILPTGSQNNPKITHSVASHVSYFLSWIGTAHSQLNPLAEIIFLVPEAGISWFLGLGIVIHKQISWTGYINEWVQFETMDYFSFCIRYTVFSIL